MNPPTSAMPIHDWQFWVVTIIAIIALGAAIRALKPKRKGKSDVPASLTIEGESPRRSRKRKAKQDGA